ncbi:hypothetical protein ACFLXL_01980 [Chloroflexota bacterium]
MYRYLLKGFIASMLAVLLTATIAVPVMAADMRGGESITIDSGEVVNGDLYAAGGDIIINGTVNGDVWAAGRNITINGNINGAVTAAAQVITLNGSIARSARIAGQALVVSSNIETDLIAFGATLVIANKAKVGSDLFIGCSTARIDGQIDGSINGGAGEITLNDSVGGDVKLEVEKLTITSTASIGGNLDYTSETEAIVQSSARISGKITQTVPEPKDGKQDVKAGPWIAAAGIASAILWKVLGFIMILVIGIIIIFTARRRITSMADAIRTNPLSSLGWGALILFVTPIAAIIVCCTVIGLPLGIIALVLYGIAIYLSQIPVALCIGRLIFRRFGEGESGGIMVGMLAAGLAILAILGLIPVIGFLVGLGTVIFGLGSLIASQVKLRAEAR